VTPEALRVQLEWLAANCRVVEMHELLNAAENGDSRNGPGSQGAVHAAIAFDDGYEDIYEYALPLLRALNLPATVFFVSAFAGAIPPADSRLYHGLRLLSWDQVRQMQQHRVTFECHTHHHKKVTNLSTDEMQEELQNNRTAIEKETGRAARYFAYPWGYPDAFHESAGQHLRSLGFLAAFTTIWGKLPRVSPKNRYFLPRLDICAYDTLDDFSRKVLGYYDYIGLIHRIRSTYCAVRHSVRMV
jgi:peptidoglycan/xylan/chitin deacetylase (PgdA/CDA1 family)